LNGKIRALSVATDRPRWFDPFGWTTETHILLWPTTVNVSIESDPQGAEIWENGTFLNAKTDLQGAKMLEATLHAMVLRKKGFKDCPPDQQSVTPLGLNSYAVKCVLVQMATN